MKRTTTLAALVSLAAAPAFAGSNKAPSVEPAVTQAVPIATGADWTGGYVGAQLGYGDVDTDNGGGANGDGFIGGLHAGYDIDLGDWVIGGEFDVDSTDINLSAGGGDIDSVARLKLRAGYDLGPTLVYGTVGAAFAEADLGSDTGFAVGAGVERRITDAMSIGGEVLYHQFDNYNGSGIDVNATTATARVKFRF
ncbi:hypothetical protein ACMU_06810 [Actibacterium mucosum KCTC 23349]|uniref:Outer membrane protein beta-barrel domain-containing protein n=1 Tax=Actibacterium mucosum KCTC 23349 TaxID=1454373 RepID=A0A037ZKL6_9RHOB|nr:outer membrane beta-barrel protein [Actibacterium mucosum]KAJ56648.1 hypothetical protein ACMU_06810 [Actibacterium mucosum KCTC 23349]